MNNFTHLTDAVYWIWLQQLFGVGTARSHQMMEAYETPKKLYDSFHAGELPQAFLAKREREQVQSAMEQAKKILHSTHRKNCQVITPDHPDYPPLLQHTYAKPAALYVKGDLSCLQDTMPICMVGTRHNSKYGKDVATTFSEGLVQYGVTIISGLAHGIDSISHSGALAGGGKTIGLLACGLDIDYPKGSARLKRSVCENGAVVSEYPMGTKPLPPRFPPRNRVLAGMSRGVIVIEAGKTSGSLITANHALDMGREVFAVPGSIFTGKHVGTHELIQQGKAKLVSMPTEVLEEYPEYINSREEQGAQVEGIEQTEQKVATAAEKQRTKVQGSVAAKTAKTVIQHRKLPQDLDEYTQQVYLAVDQSRQTADQLALKTKLPIEEVLSALTVLEILGFVKSSLGGFFSLMQ